MKREIRWRGSKFKVQSSKFKVKSWGISDKKDKKEWSSKGCGLKDISLSGVGEV